MKHKIIFLLCLLLLGASKKNNIVFNQHLKVNINEIRKVAVLSKNKSLTSYITAGIWETDLINLGFKVLDRGNIDSILKEQKLSKTGLFNEMSQQKIGELLGIDAILVIDEPISLVNKNYKSSGRVHMINASNGRIIFSTEIYKKNSRKINLASMLEPALKDLGWKHFYKKIRSKDIWTFEPLFAKAPYFKQNSIKKVALFSNITHDLISPLLSVGYDIIEREALNIILTEQKLSLTGLLSQKEMKKVGKLYGTPRI